MKQLAFFLICLSSLLAFGSSGVKLPSGWEPMAGAQYNMSLYAQVEDFDGRLVEVPGSVLAVFDAAGVCRGAAAYAPARRGARRGGEPAGRAGRGRRGVRGGRRGAGGADARGRLIS